MSDPLSFVTGKFTIQEVGETDGYHGATLLLDGKTLKIIGLTESEVKFLAARLYDKISFELKLTSNTSDESHTGD